MVQNNLYNPQPPEHEYLVIEIEDQVDGKCHFLVLEHFTSPTPAPTNTADKDLIDKFKQLFMTVKKTPLALMEEGSSNGLTISDEISVSVIQSADLVMEGLRKSHNQVAVDHFVGRNIFVKEYLGQVV